MPQDIVVPPRRRGRPPRTEASSFVDQCIGARIQLYRRSQRLTQAALGEGLGVTFQQIQKYENGRSRVTVSTLYQIADLLNVPIMLFFTDLPDAGAPNPLSDPDTMTALHHFQPLPKPVKKQMVALMKVLRATENAG